MTDEKKRFRRAFAPNPAPRYGDESVKNVADEIVYVCPGPIFDNVVNDAKAMNMFREFVDKTMEEYDPRHDVILDYGDPWILSMMIYAMPECQMTIGRYNKRTEGYTFMTLEPWWEHEAAANKTSNGNANHD